MAEGQTFVRPTLMRAISVFAILTASAAAGVASAQQYPAKAIRLVVPLAPGGGADTLGRYIGKHLTEALGQPVVIENRAGGGGLVGGEYVARAAPDGYTLIVGGSGQLVVTLTHRRLHLLNDFTPISSVGEYSALLVVHPSLPVKTVSDLVKLAKMRPGQINCGSAGTGSAGHLAMEMFRTAAGIDIVHIPYKGAGPALTEVVAGQVSMLFNNPLGSMPHVRSGRVRAVAISGARRMAAMPDIPTVAESGLPGFDATFFLGLLGPAGLPRDIVSRLNSDTIKIVQRRDVRDWLALQGMDAAASTPEAFAVKIRTEMDKLEKLVRDTGLRLN
jgi:tripartite-type tricarboxylate transporter receptor subunit TctC